jgi:glycosyltransferase involved in cell wall biosynthesis
MNDQNALRQNPFISVVVLVYRSQDALRELHRRLVAVHTSIDPNYELNLSEVRGGTDFLSVMQDIARDDPRVRSIQLGRNFGQHTATICGFSHARGLWIAILDDDLEQAPECLPDPYNKCLEGHDLVYCVYPGSTHKVWCNIPSGVPRWLFNQAIPSLNYAYTSYRVIRGDLARALTQFYFLFLSVDGWLTNRYATVEVPHGVCSRRTSNYTLRKFITHTINIFVTFSDLPLRRATWIGFTAFIIVMVWLTAIAGRFLFGGISVSGYASIMAGILLFGGVQLLVLGAFGQFRCRMNFKSSKKPLFSWVYQPMQHRTDKPLCAC